MDQSFCGWLTALSNIFKKSGIHYNLLSSPDLLDIFNQPCRWPKGIAYYYIHGNKEPPTSCRLVFPVMEKGLINIQLLFNEKSIRG